MGCDVCVVCVSEVLVVGKIKESKGLVAVQYGWCGQVEQCGNPDREVRE